MRPIETMRIEKVNRNGSKKVSRSGFALLLVMIITAIGVLLGMSYLSVASIHMKISRNYTALSKARYLAESGLEHGLYILRIWPEKFGTTSQKTLGPYHLDESSDYYTIQAVKDAQARGRYTLSATGIVGKVRRKCSVTVYRSAAPEVKINHGILSGSGGLIWLPMQLTVNGDIHINGSMFNLARINGNVSATRAISDPFRRISGSITSFAEKVDCPDFTVKDYLHYRLNMVDYSATQFSGRSLKSNNPLANGKAITATNPGGVVHLKPKHGNTVRLTSHLNFVGTLVINGNVVLDGRNITLSAVPGFPAIVATGTVQITNAARNVTINGTVIAKNGIIESGSTWNSSTVINGGLISETYAYSLLLRGKHVLNFAQEKSVLYDFTAGPENTSPQVSLIDWND